MLKFKEVNYKFIYNNMLRFIFIRKYKKLFFTLFNLKLFLWFRKMEFEDVSLLKLYNNLVFFFWLFNEKLLVSKVGSTLERGIYYYRLLFSFKMFKKKNIYLFLDIFLNSVIPNTRKDTIFFFNINNDILLRTGDTTYFSNIKIGEYYYIEHMTDIIYIQYSFKYLAIKNYLNIFKFKYINGF